MKIVITGGTGFIGLGLARAIVARGGLDVTGAGRVQRADDMVLFDQHVPAERPAGLDDTVRMVAGDISRAATAKELIDRDDVCVFHLASVVSAGGEKDFDLAMAVNLDGGRHILEALRARTGRARMVFASSVAVFGGDRMAKRVGDDTKPNPQTTYGMTKFIGEMMINDSSRKGFLDGRSARLPTIVIRPGVPNAAASSFASGIFREPLAGKECRLPVSRDTVMALLGHRKCIDGLIMLMEMDGAALGSDRAVGLPSRSYSLHECIAALETVAAERAITLGAISEQRDQMIEKVVAGWPAYTDNSRAEALGLACDEDLEAIIADYLKDYG